MSIEGIYRKKIETVDTDKLREFEKNTNNQLFDLLVSKKEEETKTLEEATKRLPELEKEIEQLKRAKEELKNAKLNLDSQTFESEVEEKEPTTHADREIVKAEAELVEFAELVAKEEETMMRPHFRR